MRLWPNSERRHCVGGHHPVWIDGDVRALAADNAAQLRALTELLSVIVVVTESLNRLCATLTLLEEDEW